MHFYLTALFLLLWLYYYLRTPFSTTKIQICIIYYLYISMYICDGSMLHINILCYSINQFYG